MYLVRHPTTLSQPFAVFILVAGIAMVYINWEADIQRQQFRETGGKNKIWGKAPKIIIAKYKTGTLHCFCFSQHIGYVTPNIAYSYRKKIDIFIGWMYPKNI